MEPFAGDNDHNESRIPRRVTGPVHGKAEGQLFHRDRRICKTSGVRTETRTSTSAWKGTQESWRAREWWSIDASHRGNGLGIKYGDCPETKRTDQDMHRPKIPVLPDANHRRGQYSAEECKTVHCVRRQESVLANPAGWEVQYVDVFQHAIVSVSVAADAFRDKLCTRDLGTHDEPTCRESGRHDDFLIVGCGTTDEEAAIYHDKNMRAFLDRARERNLRLNAEKMKLKMTEVPYIGHPLTREGFHVDPKKVEAIGRLIGSVNYLAKFVPHLSDILEPLRRLMDKDTEWCWWNIHQQAFDRLKKALTGTPVLQYYDVKKPLCIQCDASDGGLGAGLLQDGLPMVYASRALTASERNYAQIEKELLTIVFACEKFGQYVYGREKVHVQSDHKPLEVIFRKPLVTAPRRL